jgi:anti-anti-sigma factor
MVSQRKLDDESVVINPGRFLDNSNSHEMTDAMVAAQANGYKYIILDMTDLEFLSSAGVGSILGSVGRLRERGGDIILCNVSDRVMHILSILDLSEYLTIKQDEQSAKESCIAKG